jgi:hypothetical protein
VAAQEDLSASAHTPQESGGHVGIRGGPRGLALSQSAVSRVLVPYRSRSQPSCTSRHRGQAECSAVPARDITQPATPDMALTCRRMEGGVHGNRCRPRFRGDTPLSEPSATANARRNRGRCVGRCFSYTGQKCGSRPNLMVEAPAFPWPGANLELLTRSAFCDSVPKCVGEFFEADSATTFRVSGTTKRTWAPQIGSGLPPTEDGTESGELR